MKIISSYGVEVLRVGRQLNATTKYYRKAVSYFVAHINEAWDDISSISDSNKRFNYTEHLFHKTSKNPNPRFADFEKIFYKMPSGLRRAAISESIGHVSSYRSNYANWLENGKQGDPPKLSVRHRSYPCFYNATMYETTEDPCLIYLKVLKKNDWVWVPFRLLHTDVKYLKKYWNHVSPSAPTLERKYGKYFLRFAFTEFVSLSETPVQEQTICSVDLGLNTDAVCSIMRADGTILARKFINFPCDKDHLYTVLNRIKKFQKKHSPQNVGSFWGYARHLNDELSKKIANAIVEFSVLHKCDAIVFEYLDFGKKKLKGSKKQRLTMWRKKGIQKIVANKAHRYGMRISRICAWGTSKLAFDGSGEVVRDSDNHAWATFASGKRYNCDLSASYNIGARYFIRELLKTMPVTVWSDLGANVPATPRRTLSTLRELNPIFFADKAA